MGSAYWETSDSIAEFTMLVAPITYTTAENPDTMNITIVTDQYTVGSSMVIDALQFEYPPVNVEKVEINSTKVYPNPCNEILTVSSENPIESVQILNMTGKLVLEKRKLGKNSTLHLQDLPSGMYIVRINDEKSSRHQKIMKR